MLHVFVATIAPGRDPDNLLTAETQQETQAQVMTPDEAAAVGFKGIVVPEGHEVRVIAVAARDARWIHRALEANPGVTSYKVSEIE
jgi:hypothetical protein